jgi:UDP-glucose-4-epimerase GalE
MNVLVLGGAGYIGSHMLLALRRVGWRVTVFDNLSRGFADAVGGVSLVVGDLRSRSDIENCLGAQKFDLIYHFAALAYVGESVHQPSLYYQNNVVGTIHLLDAMIKQGVNRIVFSSTCATYGEPTQIPIPETHPQNPINPYGRTKMVIERTLEDYAAAYQVRGIVLRYFNAAGCDTEGRAGERHDPETHLVPLVLAEAARLKGGGDPDETSLSVFGTDLPTQDGSCIRDYIHVTDLCDAHLLAGQRLLDGGSRGVEFFNLANGAGFSVLEVIDMCRQVTGQPIKYRAMDRRAGDPVTLVGDATLAGVTLGWNPRVSSLRTIVETAWRWMERNSVAERICDARGEGA